MLGRHIEKKQECQSTESNETHQRPKVNPVLEENDEARSRIAKCEEQLKCLTGKVGNIENAVSGLKRSFHETLKSSLEANSRTL